MIHELTVSCQLQSIKGVTSGEACMLALAQQRFRFAPEALVRKWPRHDPSGFMFGTTKNSASRSSRLAMASSRSVSRRRKPSIHHSAMLSPGCWRAMTQILGLPSPDSPCPALLERLRQHAHLADPISAFACPAVLNHSHQHAHFLLTLWGEACSTCDY